MSAKLLLENFDLTVKAPDSIQKLRELILQLAVQGKLVEQDPEDEPAAVLLEKIKAEKERLITEKKIKKSKPSPPIEEDEIPHELPDGWKWAKLEDIGFTQTGTTPKKGDKSSYGNDYPFIKPGDILPDRVEYENEALSKYGVEKYNRLAPEGSVLMVCIGTIGKVNTIEKDCSFNQQINSITPLGGTSPYILNYFLRSSYFQNEAWSRASSTTISILNKGKWESILVPVPPENEQKRIVAKVDQLMALCDNLEERQQDAYDARLNLNTASLHELLNAKDSTEFDAQWQLICENFNLLYDNTENVNELRQAILQLAVQGQLVPQDPEDEPASVLLEKIKAEKERLIEEKKIKKSKPLPPVEEDEISYELPDGWEWVRLAEIINISSGQFLPKDNMINGAIPVYGGNGITGYHNEFNVEKPTIVIGRVGFYCGSVHLTSPKAWVTDNAFITTFSESNIDKGFLFWLLKATDLGQNDSSTAQPVISGRKVYPLIVGLPPLNEQKHIVAKVDKLMPLCDELEGKIKRSEELSQRLLESVVHDALAA